MQMEIPVETINFVVQLANKNNIKVILNPAPAGPLPDELLNSLYIIIPNKTEAEMLSGVKVTGWKSAKKAANIISAKGVDRVIITLGILGVLIKEGKTYYNIPAEIVTAIDTTAAGDVFNGALCVAIAEGMNVVDAARFACKASSIAVTRMGAQSSIPYRKELDAIL